VQLCKYFIEIGDSERESTVWGEINVLRLVIQASHTFTKLIFVYRFAMLEYGNKSPIGSEYEIADSRLELTLIECSSAGTTPSRSHERDRTHDCPKAAT
jgi:hypothetical protein